MHSKCRVKIVLLKSKNQPHEKCDYPAADGELWSYRAALCHDVTTGSFDGFQSKDDRAPHSAVHRVITELLMMIIIILIHSNYFKTTYCLFYRLFCRKQEAPRGSRDEKRRAQHNEGGGSHPLREVECFFFPCVCV